MSTMKERDQRMGMMLDAHAWPALLFLDEVHEVARATMLCSTCGWAVHPREPCPEQAYVRGCIHWKERT